MVHISNRSKVAILVNLWHPIGELSDYLLGLLCSVTIRAVRALHGKPTMHLLYGRTARLKLPSYQKSCNNRVKRALRKTGQEHWGFVA